MPAPGYLKNFENSGDYKKKSAQPGSQYGGDVLSAPSKSTGVRTTSGINGMNYQRDSLGRPQMSAQLEATDTSGPGGGSGGIRIPSPVDLSAREEGLKQLGRPTVKGKDPNQMQPMLDAFNKAEKEGTLNPKEEEGGFLSGLLGKLGEYDASKIQAVDPGDWGGSYNRELGNGPHQNTAYNSMFQKRGYYDRV